MAYPSLKEFLKLSSSSTVIPVFEEINADLDTPVSAFLKIKKDEYAFLFESVEGQEKIARYSFLGTRPTFIFKSKGKDIEIISSKKVAKFTTSHDPLFEIEKIMRKFRPAKIKGLPRFFGGLLGFMGYDAVRFFEKIPDKNPDPLAIEDFIFMLTDSMLIFDHVNHSIKIVSNVIFPRPALGRSEKIKLYRQAIKKITALKKDLHRPLAPKEYALNSAVTRPLKVSSNYTKQGFKNIISRAKKYIRRGDIIQAVLSQRFSLKLNKRPFDIYRCLRSINPSPYMFFLKLKSVTLIGSSPEILVRSENGAVVSRPIAGTRRRGISPDEDKRLEEELLSDAKEKAEHIMLVDLARNDLGRVCKKGSVKISGFMGVERYSHVMHLVTEVSGVLAKRFNIYDLLRWSFPAGTVSGSPKIRAMEIIDELENSRRGPYAGCVGYFSFSGNLDTCITIRTIVAKGNKAYVQAGMGIVADSQPENEYFESVNKAKALIEAITK